MFDIYADEQKCSISTLLPHLYSVKTQLGHNLNYGRSNEAGEYEDCTCMMGYSYSNDDGPIMLVYFQEQSHQPG
jgi:hypothetical protein